MTSPERLQRVTDVRLFVALLAVMGALTVALGGLISGAVWWIELILTAVVVLGVAVGCRLTRLPRAVAPIASLVALLFLVTALFASSTALLGFIPTPATVGEFGRLVTEARVSFYNQGVPADPIPEFLFLMVAAGGVIAWTADLLAVVLHRPAFVGVLVVAALSAPASLLNGGIAPLALALCLVAYLLLLRADVRSTRGAGAELGSSLAIAAGAIVVALVIGTTAPGFQQVGRQAIPASGVLFGQGVSPLIDLGADLRRPLPVTVINYTTTDPTPGYLQMTTLDAFSGAVWRHLRSSSTFFTSSTKISKVPGLTDNVKSTKVTTQVQVQNMTSSWLPAPYPVERVTGLAGSWGWEQKDLTVTGYTATTVNQQYTVVSRSLEPTAKQLRDAGNDYPASIENDLLVPKNAPAIIAATARSVTAGAVTPYDKAVALQAYFHDGQFRYSLNAPKDGGYDGDTPGTIATFLEQKAGYCVHFAAAMTFMARDLGIPARIAVGYLPGTQTGASGSKGVYSVSSDDLHAWPELFFPGVGWVPFEPTVGRGSIPDYETAQAAQPQSASTATATPTGGRGVKLATDAPATTGSPDDPTATAISSSGSVAAVILVVLALLLTPMIVRRRLRASRLASVSNGGGKVATMWVELRASCLDLGLAVPPTETPRVFAERLRRTWEEAPPGAPDTDARTAASVALDELIDAIERDRFAPRTGNYADPQLAADVVAVVAALAATAGWARRVRAQLAPVSLLEGRLRSPGAARFSS
ncbi:MAG: transglutaminaseTgpA domain-containing protein [Humibacter sp.]